MKNTITTLVIFGLLLLCSACISSKTPGEQFELTDYGVITAELVSQDHLASNPAFRYNESSNLKVEKQTDVIPAILGRRFGLLYIIHGEPKGRLIPIDIVYHLPGLKNPKDGKVHTLIKHSENRAIGIGTYAGYKFDEEWELVPGTWSIQIFYQGNKVLEKSFKIVQQE